MRYLSFFTVPYLLFLVIFTKNDKHLAQNKAKGKIQKTLDELVRTNEIPGMNFSLIDGEGKAYNFSSGHENTRLGTKMSSSFYMLSGSIGKTYVASVVLQLVDEGKIHLDEKVDGYLPKEPWLDSIPNFTKLTVKMLLGHTSGLPRWVTKPQVWDSLNQHPDKQWTYKNRLQFIFGDEPLHQPMQGWSYSDTNYILLGYLIEVVERKAFYEVLQSRILDPQNLNHTVPSDHRKIKGLAMGYSQLPDSFKIPNEVILPSGAYVFNPQMEWTGGGIASTTPDLAKWCKIYYSNPPFSKRLLKRVTQVTSTGKNVYQEKHSYGMGSFVYTTKHGVAYGHSGFMPGYNSIMLFFPKKKLALALQANCDYASANMKLTEYVEVLLDAYID